MLLHKGVLTNLKSLRQIDKGVVLLVRLVYNIFTTPPLPNRLNYCPLLCY